MPKRPVHEVIGAAAVIAGLVFVGIEIRESAKAARAAAYQELGIATAELWATLSERPELGLAVRTARQDSTFSIAFDAETQMSMVGHHMRTWRIWETVFLQVEQGLLPPEALENFGWGGPERGPFAECLWWSAGEDGFVSPVFKAYVDSIRPPSGIDCSGFEQSSREALAEWIQTR